MMWDTKKILYFVLGFALVAYLNVPTLCMAVIGGTLMLINLDTNLKLKRAEGKLGAAGNVANDEEDFLNE
jgi:mannose/fructose/N-acetylgalactosamine-specific phosphotransferase system component IIC